MRSTQEQFTDHGHEHTLSTLETSEPRGQLVHGRVSRPIAEHLIQGVEVKGLRLWYRCNSCERTIRIDMEAMHNQTYHPLVKCPSCEENVDKFHFTKHKRELCPKLKLFCEFCSTPTTNDELQSHYDACYEAKSNASSKKLYSRNITLKHINFSNTIADDLFHLASDITKLSLSDEFPADRLLKYKGAYGYTLFQTDDAKPKSFAEKRADAVLDERRKEQLLAHKRSLCHYLSKKLISSDDNIKRLYQNYLLRLKTEAMIAKLMPTSMLKPRPKPSKKSRSLEQSSTNSTKSFVVGMLPTLTPTKSESSTSTLSTCYATIASSSLDVLCTMPHTKMKGRQYTQLIHRITSNKCRQRSRHLANLQSRQTITENLMKLHRRLNCQRIQEDKEFVINQAVQLELIQETIAKVPLATWPNFISEVKNSRPIWKDLGLGPNDQDKSDYMEESRAQLERSKTILSLGHVLRSHPSISVTKDVICKSKMKGNKEQV